MAPLPRLVIYVKDIQRICGCSERSAQRMMAAMRNRFGKEKPQYISISDFCLHTGLREEEVREYLR